MRPVESLFSMAEDLYFDVQTIIFVVLLIRLCRNWPAIMKRWAKVDEKFEKYRNLNKLLIQLRLTSSIYFLISIGDYVLYITNVICYLPENWSFETYCVFLYDYSDEEEHEKFSTILGLILCVIDAMLSFTLYNVNLFLIAITTCLAEKFRQINAGVENALKENTKEVAFWKTLREDYNDAFELYKLVNKEISSLLIFVFLYNFYAVIAQLYKATLLRESSNSGMGYLFFVYSFLFLLFRTGATCLHGSNVVEESVKIKLNLLSVSSEAYNSEIEKLICTIHFVPPVLSGKRFFYLTRPLILRIAMAIATYELILIQFHMLGDDIVK
ncbi:hypothetical protein FQR65_LT13700 [Abscondita terminalis]|nr:hypothetical protein FQR65_LT13700 [Abscondita terminalis]